MEEVLQTFFLYFSKPTCVFFWKDKLLEKKREHWSYSVWKSLMKEKLDNQRIFGRFSTHFFYIMEIYLNLHKDW